MAFEDSLKKLMSGYSDDDTEIKTVYDDLLSEYSAISERAESADASIGKLKTVNDDLTNELKTQKVRNYDLLLKLDGTENSKPQENNDEPPAKKSRGIAGLYKKGY